jgi:hypothetical protein
MVKSKLTPPKAAVRFGHGLGQTSSRVSDFSRLVSVREVLKEDALRNISILVRTRHNSIEKHVHRMLLYWIGYSVKERRPRIQTRESGGRYRIWRLRPQNTRVFKTGQSTGEKLFMRVGAAYLLYCGQTTAVYDTPLIRTVLALKTEIGFFDQKRIRITSPQTNRFPHGAFSYRLLILPQNRQFFSET